jgi:hypothetical membrane protein
MNAPSDVPRARSAKDPLDLRRAGLLWMIGGMGFVLVVSVLEALYPDYSVHGNAVSDLLAVGAPNWIAGEVLMFAVAACWTAGGYSLYRDTGARGMLLLNLLPGLGLGLAVVSPENINVVVHSIGAILALVGGPFAAMTSSRTITTHLRYVAVLLGAGSFACALVEFGSYGSPFVRDTLGPGGWERAILYPLVLWFIAYGSYLMTAPPPATASEIVSARPAEPGSNGSQV